MLRAITPDSAEVKVVGQISQREFYLRTGNADGADKEVIAVFLMCKNMLDKHGQLSK